jgi:hypothetical protein
MKITETFRICPGTRTPQVNGCATLLALVVLSSGGLCAQWIGYPTADVPRAKDGKPDLLAATPRDAEGHPDLSGTWEPDRRGAPPPVDNLVNPKRQAPRGQFWDIGTGIRGGLPYQPWARELMEKRREANSKDNPDVNCLPLGILQMHTHPFLRKYEQGPGEIVILHDRDLEYRQIFTDGRPLPVDPQPNYNGYSVGKWDGDTLVVQTNGLKDGLWADYNGSPLTDATKITERFRRPNFGHMEIQVTVHDPKAYTKPWTATIKLAISLNTELLEYICVENEKDAKHMVGK